MCFIRFIEAPSGFEPPTTSFADLPLLPTEKQGLMCEVRLLTHTVRVLGV